MAFASKGTPIQRLCASFKESIILLFGSLNGIPLNSLSFKVIKSIVSFLSMHLQKQAETKKKMINFFITQIYILTHKVTKSTCWLRTKKSFIFKLRHYCQ